MIPDREDSLVSQVRAAATPAAGRKFGFVLLAGLPAAGLVWLLLIRLKTGHWVWPVLGGFALAGLLLGVSALLVPPWARLVYVGWHVVTRLIERVLTWVVLAVVFWLVITPVGRWRRRQDSAFRPGRGTAGKSCWQEVPPVKDPSRYYRQF
jgi:hypothetical protein